MMDFIDDLSGLDAILANYCKAVDRIVDDACKKLEFIKPKPVFLGHWIDKGQDLNAWVSDEKRQLLAKDISERLDGQRNIGVYTPAAIIGAYY